MTDSRLKLPDSTPPFFQIDPRLLPPALAEKVSMTLVGELNRPSAELQARFASSSAKIDIVKMKIEALIEAHFFSH